jgi:hypothetical protein
VTRFHAGAVHTRGSEERAFPEFALAGDGGTGSLSVGPATSREQTRQEYRFDL